MSRPRRASVTGVGLTGISVCEAELACRVSTPIFLWEVKKNAGPFS